jgi:hypothetical protein
VYESVVLRQLPPARVACEFEISVNQANGFEVDETVLADICVVENNTVTDD